MPGNERLTLEIEAKTIGEQAVDKLAASLEKVVNIASKKPNDGEPHKTGYEEFPAKLKEFVEAPIQSASGLLSEFSKGFGAVGIAAVGSVGAIGAIAAASYEAAKSLGELGVQTQNISIKTGLSTREVGLFTFAAKAAGSDIGVFETAMRKLSQGIEEGGAEGAKTSKALSDLGIRTRELNGDVRPTGQIFNDIGEAMEHMESTTKRNALAVALFGKSGIELVPVLMQLKENLSDADKIGLGITTGEQTRFLDLYKKKIEEVDGAWSVARRHFEEGIAGTFTLTVSGVAAQAVDGAVKGTKPGTTTQFAMALGLFKGIADVIGIDGPPSAPSAPGLPAGYISDPKTSALAKAFRDGRLTTKEGIESRISDLQGQNKESEAKIGTGIGAAETQQAMDSIAANQKIIDSLHLQLKRMEQSAGELEAASKKLDDLRKEGHSFITFGSGKNQTVITDDEMSKWSSGNIANGRRINPPTLDIAGRDDSYIRSNSDLDALNTRDYSRISRFQVEAGSEYFKDAGHRDDIAMRGINDTADRQVRMAGIGAQPDDAIALAQRQLQIRLAAVGADKQILATSLDQAGAADKLYALEQRGRAAQLEYNEKIGDQLAKQQEQFRSVSGSIFDALMGGEKGMSGFLKSQLMGVGRTVFENAAQMGESSIMSRVPHATDRNSMIGKLLKGTPFGVDPLKGSATALDTSAEKLSSAADKLAMSPSSGGGSTTSGLRDLAGFNPASWGTLSSNPLSGMPVNLPGPYDNPTGNPDAITEIDPNQSYGAAPSGIPSSQLKIGTIGGDLTAGVAAIGGVISGIKAFGGSGSGGVNAKLDGIGGILGSASMITSMIKGVSSSIPIIGGIVAAAMPLIASFIPNGQQTRANEIWKETTQGQYFAPTALNETMSTDGTYLGKDSRGNLIKTGFSARPQVTDPYLYWGPNNTPINAPGGVTSPYSPGPTGSPTVIVNHNYAPGALQMLDGSTFHKFAQDNHAAIGEAAAKNLNIGDSLLARRVQRVTGTGR